MIHLIKKKKKKSKKLKIPLWILGWALAHKRDTVENYTRMKNLGVIGFCFEVFIERPSNLLARTCTWSSYKHHNTVKVFIGIAPQGIVS